MMKAILAIVAVLAVTANALPSTSDVVPEVFSSEEEMLQTLATTNAAVLMQAKPAGPVSGDTTKYIDPRTDKCARAIKWGQCEGCQSAQCEIKVSPSTKTAIV